MNEYQAIQFRRKLQTSLDGVKLILDRQRAQGISSADAAPHRFEDKFLLVNQLTNCLGISIYTALASIGFTREKLSIVQNWAENKAVSIRLVKDTACTFVKEATRKEESARSVEVEYSIGMLAGKSTSKVVTTITEFFYNYEVSYRIEVFRGMGSTPEDILEINSRTSRMECISRTKSFPFPESTSNTNQASIGWFIRHLQADTASSTVNFDFQISREDSTKCRTATRNPQVEEAISSMATLRSWCESTRQFFAETVRSAMQRFQNEAYSKLDMDLASSATDVFVPILAAFRDPSQVEEEETPAITDSSIVAGVEEVAVSSGRRPDPVVDGADIGTLLDGHATSLLRKLTVLDESFPASAQLQNNLVSNAEAKLIFVMEHIVAIIEMHRQSMDYMEDMLRTQIIAAIGREVTPDDFDKYMQFHYRKLYREHFAPRPWSMSVRRTPKHAPEGTVRIEIERSPSDGGWQPIETFCKSWTAPEEVPPMTFPINAATSIAFQGTRHVHGYLSHAFQAPRSSSSRLQLRLVAASRQFSSFMVVLGRVSSATTFDPKHAFIVENKEEMIIPLHGETIPSAKEFRDAISSLSPAQQRFAKAYRAMQLESTLFGVLLIQIKPPMERVLRLYPDSLTKEIKLSQDLLRLFLEYQISSDLLCCEDELNEATGENTIPATRIRHVQENVRRVQDMIEAQIKVEVAEAQLSRVYEGNAELMEAESLRTRSISRGVVSSASGGASIPQKRILSVSLGVPPPAPGSVSFGAAPPPPPPAPMPMAALPSPAGANALVSPKSSTEGSAAEPMYGVPEGDSSDDVIDMTKIPAQLDTAFDELDPQQHAVRPTILHTGPVWQFVKQKPLALTAGSNGTSSVAAPPTTPVGEDMQLRHRLKAFDLLDAMTRSGALTLQDCELHVVIAATHAFDRSLMNTLVQANENPIENVERSSAILASTLHKISTSQLILPAHAQRLLAANPQLSS